MMSAALPWIGVLRATRSAAWRLMPIALRRSGSLRHATEQRAHLRRSARASATIVSMYAATPAYCSKNASM